MWHLNKIKATNICSFENIEYCPINGATTLIFGNNMDSDTQNSNGSGKSALVEAIAIGLTGEPLRKVNMDEIINDRYEEAYVEMYLTNDEERVNLRICRKISRKNPQQISVIRQTGCYSTDTEDVKEASVADYNKYILDQLGISKDDIYSYFILTARKYRSFLSSSDKDKKEIINRFSNGAIVDESIEHLKADIDAALQNVTESEKKHAAYKGRLEAIVAEIETTTNDATSRKIARAKRIAGWKEAIENNRAEIRKLSDSITAQKSQLGKIEYLDEQMQDLEESEEALGKCYEKVATEFAAHGLNMITNYKERFEKFYKAFKEATANLDLTEDAINEAKNTLKEAKESVDTFKTSKENSCAEIDKKILEANEHLTEFSKQYHDLQQVEKNNKVKSALLTSVISELEIKLAGVIECPKCQYRFTLDNDIDVAQAKKDVASKKQQLQDINENIEKARMLSDDALQKSRETRQQINSYEERKTNLEAALAKLNSEMEKAKSIYESAEAKYDSIKESISSYDSRIKGLRKAMFDETFDSIDNGIQKIKNAIKGNQDRISTLKGSIESYQESIAEAEKADDSNIITSLKKSRSKYEAELSEASKELAEVTAQYNVLKKQEIVFNEFKTHLANLKIRAISQIINNFLKAIGSDIRVVLTGYSITKTGKLREKISVTLTRDGIDCGSFEKFSKGEQTRVELASILALHKLINVDMDFGKGLDLLIFDEVLDATDESGLGNVFKALNETKITSLIISHGSVAENYPNKLIVNKKDGISFI